MIFGPKTQEDAEKKIKKLKKLGLDIKKRAQAELAEIKQEIAELEGKIPTLPTEAEVEAKKQEERELKEARKREERELKEAEKREKGEEVPEPEPEPAPEQKEE